MPKVLMPRDPAAFSRMLHYLIRRARLNLEPKKVKFSRLPTFNRDQEEARRRRQFARHGRNYWCPIWGVNFTWR